MTHLKSLASTALILSMAAGSAFAQSNDVKGWTPKPKAPIAGGGGGASPSPIARGPETPPPGPGFQPPGGGGAAFDVVLANDPVGIQQAMMNAGYRAELTTDDQGNPKIVGTASKSTYWILFLDCQAKSGCLGLEFYVSYSLEQKPSLEQVDQFNNDFRYIRAFTNSEGQPRMMMDILVRDGGMDTRTFLEYVRLWTVIMPSFEEMIGV